MRFVDQANIKVIAGKGGDGCLSFRREKFIPKGGPDGGDGGDGGSIYIKVDKRLSTLVDFCHRRLFQADNGRSGMGRNRIGKSARDLYIKVPGGTLIYDDDTGELIGDLVQQNSALLVARGGFHGLGNTRFKSSVNRAPRKITKGGAGEERHLRLELHVLANVGLLGRPNAGKSSFLSAVSAAAPKVGDYPFTTVAPNLGTVRVDTDNSFVIADIPGLIEGAASGAGLGITFLKHLSRTCLLLHLVDMGQEEKQVLHDVNIIENEIKSYSKSLFNKERWLVFNKSDLVTEDVINALRNRFQKNGRVIYVISTITKQGCKELIHAIDVWMRQQENTS